MRRKAAEMSIPPLRAVNFLRKDSFAPPFIAIREPLTLPMQAISP